MRCLGVGLGMCEKGVAAAVGVGVMDGVLREVFFLERIALFTRFKA